ncbi:AI-2E family transporter [Nocardia alni]|uniref:AI-2E family transporter n=1 Tax=Nocardia alni TaxID=2815723 RepID=UPI001C2464F2|nr:AI-2E family transporter [Nocardia alni]
MPGETSARARRSAKAGRTAADSVHPYVRVGAEWCWRLLILVLTVVVVGYLSRRLATVVIPVAIALLIAALLSPLVDLLQRLGLPRALGVLVAMVGSIGVIAGVFTFVIEQFITGVPQLVDEFKTSIHTVQNWLINGPLHLSNDQIQNYGNRIVQTLEKNQSALTSGALSTAAAVGEFLTGAFLTMFILIFFLYGGDQIWQFVTRIVPTPQRDRVRIAGRLGFGTLIGFVRATVVVAAVDAIGIGTGLAILSVPLALPLGTLVFIGAFIPIIGSLLAGSIAVFLALMTKGLVTALIVLGITIAVMQLESHVLQPLLLGRAVRIHPLAVVLSITTGVVLYGLVGGLLAVPFAAVMNTAIHSLLAGDPQEVYQELHSGESGQPMYHAEPDSPDPSRYNMPEPPAATGESGASPADSAQDSADSPVDPGQS